MYLLVEKLGAWLCFFGTQCCVSTIGLACVSPSGRNASLPQPDAWQVHGINGQLSSSVSVCGKELILSRSPSRSKNTP